MIYAFLSQNLFCLDSNAFGCILFLSGNLVRVKKITNMRYGGDLRVFLIMVSINHEQQDDDDDNNKLNRHKQMPCSPAFMNNVHPNVNNITLSSSSSI